MISGLFKNGNRRIAKLVLLKVAVGSATVVLIQVQGHLPSLDFLDPKTLKMLSFILAVLLTVIKAVEMFLDKTTSLLKDHEISFDTQEFPKPEAK